MTTFLIIVAFIVLLIVIFGCATSGLKDKEEKDAVDYEFNGRVVSVEPTYGFSERDIYHHPWFLGIDTDNGFKYLQFWYYDQSVPDLGAYGKFVGHGTKYVSFAPLPDPEKMKD